MKMKKSMYLFEPMHSSENESVSTKKEEYPHATSPSHTMWTGMSIFGLLAWIVASRHGDVPSAIHETFKGRADEMAIPSHA